jgi:hypothetical protein
MALLMAVTTSLVSCGTGPTSPGAAPTVTTTATATATATFRSTVTATATVTATIIKQVPAAPEGPADVTAEYIAHARNVGMPHDQRDEIVQVTLNAGVLNVLTTMRYPWGSWACDWEPTTLAGTDIKFVRILHEDNSLFRICK